MWLSSSSRADTHTHTPIWHWCNDADMIGLLWWVRKKWVYPFTEHMWSEVEFGHKFTRASRITVESKLLFQIPLTPTLGVIRRRSFEWPSMHSNYPAELLHSSGISIKRHIWTTLVNLCQNSASSVGVGGILLISACLKHWLVIEAIFLL